MQQCCKYSYDFYKCHYIVDKILSIKANKFYIFNILHQFQVFFPTARNIHHRFCPCFQYGLLNFYKF